MLAAAQPLDLEHLDDALPVAIEGAPKNLRQPPGWQYGEFGISRIDEKTEQLVCVCRTPIILTKRLKKTDTGEVVTRPADIVIMALGNRPDKSYEQQLKDAFDKVVFVGDANKGGTMADATLSAYENCWFF